MNFVCYTPEFPNLEITAVDIFDDTIYLHSKFSGKTVDLPFFTKLAIVIDNNFYLAEILGHDHVKINKKNKSIKITMNIIYSCPLNPAIEMLLMTLADYRGELDDIKEDISYLRKELQTLSDDLSYVSRTTGYRID